MKDLKLILCILVSLLLSAPLLAQSKYLRKIQSADLLFEGQITHKKSFEQDGKIYTRYTAQVYKNFKNASTTTVHFVGYGGQAQNRIATYSGAMPRLGEKGIFSARKTANFAENYLDFEGVITYGLMDKNIMLPDGSRYENTEKLYADFYAHGLTFSVVKQATLFDEFLPHARTEADLEITSLVPLEITGGTRNKLTINGKGFGDEIGEGNIYFTKNEDGGQTKQELIGRWWGAPGSAELLSWTDTKIEVYVPYFAGSGTVIVKNNQGQTFESLEALNIPYSLTTISNSFGWFPEPAHSEAAQNPDLVNHNGKGGYTLFADPEFFRNAEMLAAFNRALTTWRCATGINITLASSLEKVEFGYSGKNAVTLFYPDFDTDQSSFVYSNYNTCNDGKRTHIGLTEFQLFFNATANWNFSTSAPATNQLDFESEALRLLGKVSQIEYVNDPASPMFYQLGRGKMKRNLTSNMQTAANNIIEQSKEENDCGSAPMTILGSSDCQNSIEDPKARFEAITGTEFCKSPVKVEFEDFSKNVIAWEWTIKGANPEISTEQHPAFSFPTGGNYTVSLTVTGANGKKSTETKENYIKIASQNVQVELGADLVICQNQKVTLDAGNEGATYEWSNGATTQKLETGIAGTYSVTVTKGGCSATDQITLTIDKSSAIDASANTKICRGSSVQLQAKGGNGTFRWEPAVGLSDPSIANPIASPDSTTIYRVYSDSDGNCGQVYDSVRITVEEAPQILGLPENREVVMCGSESRAFIGVYSDQENLQYQWSNGSQESYIEVFEAGRYTLTVTSQAGCQLFDTVHVIKVDEITLQVPADTSFCEGEGGIFLEAKGAAYYQWQPIEGVENPYESRIWVSPKQTTTYTITGYPQGFGACEPATAQVTVSVLPKPTLELGKDEIIACQSEIILDAKNEGSLFQWSNGSQKQQITISKSGTYFVTVLPKGCTQPLYDSIKVTFPELYVDLGADTVIVCEANSWKLDAQNTDNQILWSDGSRHSELFVTASGVYSVQVTHPTCGNSVTDTITILFPRVQSFLPKQIASCERTVSVSAAGENPNPDALYEWSDGSNTPNLTISKSGRYIVTISSKLCPTQSVSDTIDVILIDDTKLNVQLGDAEVLACGTLTLDAGNEGANYRWSDGSTARTLSVTEDGTYFVSVSYECGRTVTDEITVHFFKNTLVDFEFEAQGETMIFTSNIDSKHKTRWEWNFGENSEKSTQKNPSYVFNRIGNYNVTLTVWSEDCEAEPISITKIVTISFSGINEQLTFGKLDIYPNPAQNQMTVKRSKSTEKVQLKLIDLTGKVLQESELTHGQYQHVLMLDELPNGMYFLEMRTETGIAIRKIIKE